VQANEFWGTEFWGTEFWGTEFWGTHYWEPAPAPPPPGTSTGEIATTSLNNATEDWLPAGAYWLTPR
jgi:hypothetical protein